MGWPLNSVSPKVTCERNLSIWHIYDGLPSLHGTVGASSHTQNGPTRLTSGVDPAPKWMRNKKPKDR